MKLTGKIPLKLMRKLLVNNVRQNAGTVRRFVNQFFRLFISIIFRRLIWWVLGSIGFPALITIVLILFAGGAIISFASIYDWDMNGSGNEGIKEELQLAAEMNIDPKREEQIPFKIPLALLAGIERVRTEKDGNDLQAEKTATLLKPVFTYETYSFEHHRYTIITTCNENGCKSYQTKLTATRPKKRLLIEAKTWEGTHSFHYRMESEDEFKVVAVRKYITEEGTKTFTDYLKRVQYWEQDETDLHRDYTMLLNTLDSLHFSGDDRILLEGVVTTLDVSITFPEFPPSIVYLPSFYGPHSGNITGDWGWPTPRNHVITSGFGIRTRSGDRVEFHRGIDIAPLRPGVDGDPVYAAADGEVTRAEWSSGGYGWVVYIKHANGYETRYAHLSGLSIIRGQQVRLGDFIGTMGNTGDSTGTHLHLELRHNDLAIDPLLTLHPF